MNIQKYSNSSSNNDNKETSDPGSYEMGKDERQKSTRVQFWEGNVSEKLKIRSTKKSSDYIEVELESPFQGFFVKTHFRYEEMHGLSTIYSKAGLIMGELTFVDGVATGPCTLNDESGKLFFKGKLKKGYCQGRGTEYDEYGNVIFDGFYNQGKRIESIVPLKEIPGYWKEYDEDWKLISISERDDFGRKKGICYFYGGDEKLRTISEWNEDRETRRWGYCTIYDEPRRIWYKGHFDNGYCQGRGTEYDESGNVIFDGFYNKGKRIETIVPLKEMPGYWKEYDENRKLLSVSQRDDYGRKKGICYFYDDKDKICRISEWKEDKEISTSGDCEIYDVPRSIWLKKHFENGMITRTITFKGKNGYWEEYDDYDKLVYIGKKYNKGKDTEIHYIYNNGSINRISLWKSGKEVKLIKQFNGSAMEEYYENGQKCYEGGFLDSFELDYPRNGDGEEYYPDGKTLLFKGSYNNGRKHGKGRSYKNNEINRKTVWLAGYSKEGLLLTLLAVIAMFIASLLIDVILGLVFLVIAILLIIIRWSCSKLLGNSICNRTDIKLMADYFRDEYSKSTKTGKGTKRILSCFFGNIYFSVIFFVFLLLICICTSAHFYYNAVNTYVSVFQTTYTAKSFRNNNIANFRLSFKPFLKTIEIENQCFEVASVFQLKGLNSLNSVKIGSKSFTKGTSNFGNDGSKSFHILNCKHLQSIQIGESSFSDFGGDFEIRNLPSLKSLEIGVMNTSSYNFYSVKSFIIEGMEQYFSGW